MKQLVVILILLFTEQVLAKSFTTVYREKTFGDEYLKEAYAVGIILKNVDENPNVILKNEKGNEVFNSKDGQVKITKQGKIKKIKIKTLGPLEKGKYFLIVNGLKTEFEFTEFLDFKLPVITIGNNFMSDHSFTVDIDGIKDFYVHAWVSDWDTGEEFWYDYSKVKFSKLIPNKPNSKDSKFTILPKAKPLYLNVRVDINKGEFGNIKLVDQYNSFKKFELK